MRHSCALANSDPLAWSQKSIHSTIEKDHEMIVSKIKEDSARIPWIGHYGVQPLQTLIDGAQADLHATE